MQTALQLCPDSRTAERAFAHRAGKGAGGRARAPYEPAKLPQLAVAAPPRQPAARETKPIPCWQDSSAATAHKHAGPQMAASWGGGRGDWVAPTHQDADHVDAATEAGQVVPSVAIQRHLTQPPQVPHQLCNGTAAGRPGCRDSAGSAQPQRIN